MRHFVSMIGLSLTLLVACSGQDPASDTGDGGASSSSTGGGGGTGGGSAGGGGISAAACFDHQSFVATPGVDFETDVIPILEANCNAATCHGSVAKPDGNLYLGAGSGNDATTLDIVYANLVGASAARAPGMKRVVPADSANSFLMVKLDDDLDCPQVACVSAGCGSKMPYGATKPLLAEASRELIRSWIANGAPR